MSYYRNLEDILKDVKENLTVELFEALKYWMNEEKQRHYKNGFDDGYEEGYEDAESDFS